MRRVLSISVMMLLLLESVVAQNKPMAGDWVRGVVTDILGNIIDRVSVMELNVAGDTVKEVPTDSLGAFNFILINPKDSIRFFKRGYWDTVVSINRLYYQISLRDKPEPESEPEPEPEPDLSDMVPAYDASENEERFIVCDYEESLIEVVPDSFICGYTFSPYGYKPYGMFLQKDSAGYRVVLNYYKYDRDRIDDVMSTAVMEKSEWEAGNLIEAAKRDLDRAKVYQKGPKVDIARDFNVVKVLMDGKAAEHWKEILLNIPWCNVYYDFKSQLGPEPMANANRWEVTPYYNPSETAYESYHWISSNDLSNYEMVRYYNDYIIGNVFVDYWGSGGCIVKETDSKGRLVNATCTDERGFFYLQVKDPDVLMLKASLTRYDEERGKFLKYEPVVKKIAEKEIDEEYSSFWYTIDNVWNYFNLNDVKVTRRPRFSKQKVVVVTGRKPTTDSAFTGVVMNAIGPLKDAVITERDPKGNIISETRTGANGEFRFDSVNPQNILHISCEGYADIRHKIEGERFIITMKKK